MRDTDPERARFPCVWPPPRPNLEDFLSPQKAPRASRRDPPTQEVTANQACHPAGPDVFLAQEGPPGHVLFCVWPCLAHARRPWLFLAF